MERRTLPAGRLDTDHSVISMMDDQSNQMEVDRDDADGWTEGWMDLEGGGDRGRQKKRGPKAP